MHIRNTLVMAAILVVLAGFVYFYEIRGRAEREEAERAASRLVAFEQEVVEGLTIERPDERVVVEKTDAGWSIVEPAGIDADDAAIDTLLDDLYRAEKDRLIAESPEDPAAFGLDAPDVTVTLALPDGGQRRVSVGKDTPIGANLYVMVGSEVYSAPQGLRQDLALGLYDLRDRSLLVFEEPEVTRLELKTPEIEGGALRTEGGEEWELTFPLAGRADADTIGDLLSDLYTSEAESFVLDGVPTPEQMQEYGLADPARVLAVWTGDDAARRLLIGSAVAESAGYYAMREGGSAVFVVPADLVETLPSSADELRNRQVLAMARERVRGIEIDRAGSTTRVERSGSEWQITRPRELAADPSAVSRLLSALQDLRAVSFANQSAGLSAPELTVRLEIGGADDAEPEQRRELLVGASTETLGEDGELVTARFVSASDDDTVYLVEDAALDPLRTEVFDLRDKTIVEFSEPDVTEIELTTADGSAHRFTREGDTWQPTGDAAEGFDPSLVDDLLWELNYLRMNAVAAEWTDTAPDLGPYGLAAPRFAVRVRAAEETVGELQIGADAGGEEPGIWVREPAGQAVYVVGASLAEALAALADAL